MGIILPGLAVAVVWPNLVGLLIRRPDSDLYDGFNTHESVEQTKVYLAKVQSQGPDFFKKVSFS